jgi:hypothetical protein
MMPTDSPVEPVVSAKTEGYPPGWHRVVVMIPPNGNDCHYMAGSEEGFDFVRRWLGDSQKLGLARECLSMPSWHDIRLR